MNREEIIWLGFIIMFFSLVFVMIYAQYSRYKTIGKYHKINARLEYERWRSGMIADGFPAPDTWEESERKLEAQK